MSRWRNWYTQPTEWEGLLIGALKDGQLGSSNLPLDKLNIARDNMKVKELIEELRIYNPESNVIFNVPDNNLQRH